jgi:nucleoside-diphosphate-sugar epimerase
MQAVKSKVQDILHSNKNDSAGKGKTVLITGGHGFVAAHVLQAFLSRGYNVRATVRNQKSVESVKKTFSQYSDQLSFAIVEDIIIPGVFDEAVKGVDGVIHTASPFVMQGIKDNVKELLDPAIKGTTGILKAIVEHNPSVKRVVIISSFSSMWNGNKGMWPEHTYNEEDWNPITFEEAARPETDGENAYSASKVLAERAAWDFMKEQKPNFTLSTILPPMLYGPAAHDPPSVKNLNTSSADIYRLCDGSEKEVPETKFFAFCDVRDVAEAHVKAYEAKVHGRFFVAGGNYTYQRICDIIRKDFPERRHLTPEGIPGQPFPPVYKVDNSKARKELGITFTPLETTIHDMVVNFEEIEKKSES